MVKYFNNQTVEIKGIILMLLSQFFFSTNDTVIKYLLSTNPNGLNSLGEIVFIRGLVATLFLSFILNYYNKLNFKFLLTSKPLIIRGFIESLAGIFFFLGLALLPLAETYVLLNLVPILITASGAIFLKEVVGWRRWSAVLLGFFGVLVVINPGKLEYGYAFIFPLISAIFITQRDVYTKKIQNNFDSFQIAFMTCVMVTLVFGIQMVFNFQTISIKELLIISSSAIFLSIGYVCSITTIKYASLSSTSVFRYTIIIWGVFYGYVMFKEVPPFTSIIGSMIIISSGIFIIHRQKKLKLI